MFKNAYYGLGSRYARFVLGVGADSADEVVRAHVVFLLSLTGFVLGGLILGMFADSAQAASDLNAIGSNIQNEASSVTKGLYYGVGGVGVATAAGGLLHIRSAHKNERPIGPGVTAVGTGAALTGIGTYLATFNQSAVQDTGGMSTNSMGIPQ